jgi:PadR family transcriptional regulator, regulatory protein PadR
MCEHSRGDRHQRGSCRCPEGRVRSFLQPRLLLLLLQESTHGYDLMERLGRDREAPAADPGLLYRTLRQLENDGLVSSTWDTDGHGAARRQYRVSPEGVEYLHAWAANIRQTKQQLDRFLAEYEAHFSGGTKGGVHNA